MFVFYEIKKVMESFKCGKQNKRFVEERFKTAQRSTLKERIAIAETLGLPPRSEEWFEMPTKATPGRHAGAPELGHIRGLSIVHFLDRGDPDIPEEVIHKTFGTILWEKRVILRQSIPYRYDIIMESLKVSGKDKTATVKLNIPNYDGSSFVENPLVKNVQIFEHTQGTIIDIMKINGEEQWFTAHNLLPKGVFTESGERIHKYSSWAPHHVAFTETLTRVLEQTNPETLEKGILFPLDTKTSNRLYRFVVASRDVLRAGAEYVGPIGHAVYLGCIEQWSNAEPPISEGMIGKPHEEKDIYKFKTVFKTPENEDIPYIIERTKSLDVNEANRILAGDTTISDKRFRGGGKLIITGNVFKGGISSPFAFHGESPAYDHRKEIMGNDAHLYRYFTDIMDLSDFDLSNQDSLNLLSERFAPLKLPLPNTDFTVNDLKKSVFNMCSKLPVNVDDSTFKESLKSNTLRLMWYNFLLCSNVSIRPTILLFLKRYIADMKHLECWLEKLSKASKSMEKARADFVFKAYREIRRNSQYNKGEGFSHVLILTGKSGKLISISRKETGTQRESIQIAEPDATIYIKKNYATVCAGTAGTRQ